MTTVAPSPCGPEYRGYLEGLKPVNLWGHCTACRRWFYMPKEDATCPVCASPPAEVEDRDTLADPR